MKLLTGMNEMIQKNWRLVCVLYNTINLVTLKLDKIIVVLLAERENETEILTCS